MEIEPGDTRTIDRLRFVGGGADDDGSSTGFNDLGQIAFYASFEEGGYGIFVSDIAASLPSLPGDFDLDNDVDGSDFLSWQRGAHSSSDLAAWRTNFGSSLLPTSATSVVSAAAVPEPATLGMVGWLVLALGLTGRFSSRRHSV